MQDYNYYMVNNQFNPNMINQDSIISNKIR